MQNHELPLTRRLIGWLTTIIILLVPFQALITTWAGANFGHLDWFRIWKELLVIPLSGLILWVVARDRKTYEQLSRSWLIRLCLAYVALHLLIGLLAFTTHKVNTQALAYGLIIDLRLVWFLMICALAVHYYPALNRTERLVLAPAALVVMFGLLQHFALPLNFLSHFGYGPKTIPAYQTVDQKLQYVRVQSTLRGPNPLGAYLLVVVTILAAVWWRAKGHLKNQISAYLAAALICLFFSYSRSAWLGLAISLGLFIYWQLKPRRRRILLMLLAAMTLVFGLLVASFRHNHTVENAVFHTDETSKSATSSNQARADSLKTGLSSAVDHPLGKGPGTAGPASFRNNHPAQVAENYYIQIAQEVGWLGLTLFIAINVMVGRELWRARRQPLALALLTSLIGLSFVNMLSHAWADDTLAYIWWGLAGICLSPAILKPVKTTVKSVK